MQEGIMPRATDDQPSTLAECFLCRKHRGLEPAPPGGYLFENEHWRVCHAPAKLGPLGTLFIESRRHFLDYGEMTDEEAGSLGDCLRRAYRALRASAQPERIYQLSTMEGVAHFHAWMVPRPATAGERGWKYLSLDLSCSEGEAIALAERIRQAMRV
jgi:diadenosine tetraphosphate (Ap4A) HIT family hydrolase